MTIQVFGPEATVSTLNRAFTDTSPANAIFNNQVTNAKSMGDSAFANAFAASWSGLSNAALSKQVLTNMGILPTTDTSVAALEQALTDYFAAFGSNVSGTNGQVTADTRGFIVLQLASILSNSETSTGNLAVYNAAAVAWNSEVAASYSYSANTANTTPTQTGTTGQSLNLTVNQDAINGGTGDDTINGFANQDGGGNLINTIQSVDTIDGGTGNDTLNITVAQALTVAPSVKNVENVAVRFAGSSTLNLAGFTGLTAVTLANSTVAGGLSEIGALASLSIKNQNADVVVLGTAGTATTMALGFDTVGTKTSTTVTPITLDLGAHNASKVTTANITMKDAYVKVDSGAAVAAANGTAASTAMGAAITLAAPGTAAATATAAIAANPAVTTAANAAAVAAGATVASVTTAAQTAASAAAQAAVKYDAITTATIAATGSNTLTFADSQSTLKSITVTGDGSLNLMEGGVLLSALTTFDASAAKGEVKAEITNAAKAVTISTGAGNDYIKAPLVATTGTTANMGAGNDVLIVGPNLAAFDKSNGGDGTDIINITDSSKLTSTAAKTITNFETLDISGSIGGNGIIGYDLSLNNFPTVQVDEAIAGALTIAATLLTKAPDAFGLTLASKAKTGADFTTGQAINVNGKDFAGTTAAGDAETFTLIASLSDNNKDGTANGNIISTGITVTGANGANGADTYVENVVIQATATAVDGGTTATANKTSAYTLTPKLTTNGTETITIKGDASVDFTGSSFTVATTYSVSKIDASASTGNIFTPAGVLGNAVNAISYTGSAGVDTYTSSAKGDMIYTGKAGDVITLTAAAIRDTLVFKAGTDSQLTDVSKDGKITLTGDGAGMTNPAVVAATGTTVDSITGFKTASAAAAATGDRIDLTNFGFASAQRGIEDISSKVTATTDLTSVTGLFSSVAGARGAAFAYVSGDAYVFVDSNKDGNFTAADDLVIKLAGVTTGIGEADFNF